MKANFWKIAIRAYRSVIYVAVADPTLSAIDRIFDFVDRGVDAADRVLNRGKQVEEQHRARRARRPDIIDAEASPKAAAPKTTATSKTTTTAARKAPKPRFYIVESIAPSGDTLFVVTDGADARTECSTREFAETILRALGGAP